MFSLIPHRNEDHWLRVFDDFERSFWNSAIPDLQQFRTDIIDRGDRYELTADLPGFDREDIRINVDGGALVISASKEEQTEKQQDNYVRRERRCGAFSRRFDLSGIRADGIQARYQHGILTLDLPKEANQLPPSRQIPIQ